MASSLPSPPSGPSSALRAGLAAVARPLRALLGTWRGRLILAVVAVQLALPLHYYLVRRDPHDERFAWRMFSPMRMTQCSVRATLDGAPVDLFREFHEAWIAIARRGRFRVIEEMGARLCAAHPGSSVVFQLDCTYVGPITRTYGGGDLCQAPAL